MGSPGRRPSPRGAPAPAPSETGRAAAPAPSGRGRQGRAVIAASQASGPRGWRCRRPRPGRGHCRAPAAGHSARRRRKLITGPSERGARLAGPDASVDTRVCLRGSSPSPVNRLAPESGLRRTPATAGDGPARRAAAAGRRRRGGAPRRLRAGRCRSGGRRTTSGRWAPAPVSPAGPPAAASRAPARG
jgi:hypothetical protein